MTDGAIAAHDGGIVTACSLVAGGPDFARAVDLLRARPFLDVGVHLVLAGGPLVSPPEEIRTLVSAGQPLRDHRAFLVRLALGRIDLEEVQRELGRQIERVRAAGIRATHLNGHQHLHVAPRIARVVARLARDHGIDYVRVPDEDVRPRNSRTLALWGLGRVARRAGRMLREAGTTTNDRAAGLVDAGHLTPPRLRAALAVPTGVTEVVTHPGVGTHHIARLWRWGYEWDAEREALCAPGLRAELARCGIALVRPTEVQWRS